MKTSYRTLVLASVLLLGACDISTPSQVNLAQTEVRETMKTQTVSRFNPAEVEIIAEQYKKTGRGPLSLTFAQGEKDAGAVRKQASLYRDAFAKRGVTGIQVEFVPVKDPAHAGTAVVAYRALTAVPPKSCGRILGYQGTETLKEADKYAIGCEVQANIARMVSDPSDLLGHAGTPDEESRRQGGVTERYRAGVPNEALDGLSASEVSEGGG